MKEFKNGQAVLCPSLSTKLLYAYHCKTTNGDLYTTHYKSLKV